MNNNGNTKVGTPLLQASIVVLVLFQLCAIFARSYLQLELQGNGYPRLFAKDLSWLMVPVILGILMLPILRQNRAKLAALLKTSDITWRLVLASIALGITLRLAFWGGNISIVSFHFLTSPMEGAFEGPLFGFSCPAPMTLGLTFLVSVVLTPLVEEVINRGFFLHALLHRGKWLAVIGSSVLFGVFHNPQMIGPATIIGVFLALQYLSARSLWAPVITHATINAVVIADSHCLNGIWNPTAVTPAMTAIGAIALALMIVSLVLAGVLTNKRWYVRRSG